MDECLAWAGAHPNWFSEAAVRRSGVQMTADIARNDDSEQLTTDIVACPPVADGRVVIAKSGHSFDVIAAWASKLNVVRKIGEHLGEGEAILCIGDSGSRNGNDNALLTTKWGISVGDVCGTPSGCWSLFGDHLTGPDAVLKVLRALIPQGSGIRLDVTALSLDRHGEVGT